MVELSECMSRKFNFVCSAKRGDRINCIRFKSGHCVHIFMQ